MSAETLRRAAALMRERADSFRADEPWWTYERHAYWGIWASRTRMGRGYQIGTGRSEAAAKHIASWSPLVAIAVAAWLEQAADWWSGGERLDHRALAVATAYLGEAS